MPIAGAGLKLLLGSLGLTALLLIAARVVKRLPIARFLSSAEGPIRVKARTHLGAKEKLCLVEVGPTALLLAITAQGVKTLHVWPGGVDTSAAPPSRAWGDGASADTVGIPGQLKSLEARIAATRR